MPSTAFRSLLPFIVRWEGGYVNHPNDPGAVLSYGDAGYMARVPDIGQDAAEAQS
ncbi:MAG: glycosyl hydrolase 108 family protein [Burkholderiales bacterium]